MAQQELPDHKEQLDRLGLKGLQVLRGRQEQTEQLVLQELTEQPELERLAQQVLKARLVLMVLTGLQVQLAQQEEAQLML